MPVEAFVIADFVPARPYGRGPRLPKCDGFRQLAEPGRGADWALYKVSLTRVGAAAKGMVHVSAELAALIREARDYPPALALARHEMSKVWDGKPVTREEFEENYRESLTRHLAARTSHPFILANAVGDELGYLCRGDKCWVCRYRPNDETVTWVSSDYFFYTNPASDFELTPAQLQSLRR